MKYSPDADKPIYIMGSGKTAIDAILALDTLGPQVRKRLRCITGRGCWFICRDAMADFQNYRKHLIEGLMMYDGTNAREVYQFLGSKGAFHAPFPDPETHMNAIHLHCGGEPRPGAPLPGG